MKGVTMRDTDVEHMLQVQKQLLDAYSHPQCFVDALELVAEWLSAEGAFLWMSRRDTQIKSWYLAAGSHACLEDMDFRIRYPQLYAKLEEQGSVSVRGEECLTERFGEEGQRLSAQGVESLLLYPVYWTNGNMAFVLGVFNVGTEEGWQEGMELLRQVSLSFLLAMDHYDNYHVLNRMGKMDIMTGMRNRNCYQMVLAELKKERPKMLGCVYIDMNGLHEINNFLGHSAGDDALRTVSGTILKHFDARSAFRIGGDEFVLLCRDWDQEALYREVEKVRLLLERAHYGISYGIAWSDGEYQLEEVVNEAENRMRIAKQQYYETDGKIRNLTQMNKQMERLLDEKRDADLFLSVLKPEFKGVYFVDLNTDTVRHIFIPDYFEEVLSEVGDVFSDAMLEYARRYARGEYMKEFEEVCNYELLRERLDRNELPGFVYQKKNGECLRLTIMRLQADDSKRYRTLWTFSDPEAMKH